MGIEQLLLLTEEDGSDITLSGPGCSCTVALEIVVALHLRLIAKLCKSSTLIRLRGMALGKETAGGETLLDFFPHWKPTMECTGQQYQAVEHSHLQYLEVVERSHCWQYKVIHLALE